MGLNLFGVVCWVLWSWCGSFRNSGYGLCVCVVRIVSLMCMDCLLYLISDVLFDELGDRDKL